MGYVWHASSRGLPSSVVSAAKQTQSNLGLTPQWMSIANSNLCQVELVSSTLRREARR